MICECDIEEYAEELMTHKRYIIETLKDRKKYKNDEIRRAYTTIMLEKLNSMALLSGNFWKKTLDMATKLEAEILEQQPVEQSSKSLLEQQLAVLEEMVAVMRFEEAKEPSNTLVVEPVNAPSH
jgi:hypothetical protein